KRRSSSATNSIASGVRTSSWRGAAAAAISALATDAMGLFGAVVALAEVRAGARRRLCSSNDVAHPDLATSRPRPVGMAVPVEPNAVAKPRKQAGHRLILPDFGSEVECI